MAVDRARSALRRLSAFDRDFRDLHGVGPAEFVGVVSVQPSRRSRTDRAGLRLTIGFLGLFWGGVLLVALAAFVFVVGIFAYAYFTT